MNTQAPPLYERPTQQAIPPTGSSLLWIMVSLILNVIGCFLLFITAYSMAISSNLSPNLCALPLVACAALIPPMLLTGLIQYYRLGQELDRRGQMTSGTVIERWQEFPRRDSGGRHTTYHFAYNFTVSGQTFGAYQKITSSEYDQLQVDDTVTIRYLPHDPTKSRAELPVITSSSPVRREKPIPETKPFAAPAPDRPTAEAIRTTQKAMLGIIMPLLFLCGYLIVLRQGLLFPIAWAFNLLPQKVPVVDVLFSLIFYLPLFVLLSMVYWLGIRGIWFATDLDEIGQTTTGNVTELWQGYHRYKKSGRTTPAYYFAYRFTVSGQTFGAYQNVDKDKYVAMRVGDGVTVRYLPTDPSKSRPEEY